MSVGVGSQLMYTFCTMNAVFTAFSFTPHFPLLRRSDLIGSYTLSFTLTTHPKVSAWFYFCFALLCFAPSHFPCRAHLTCIGCNCSTICLYSSTCTGAPTTKHQMANEEQRRAFESYMGRANSDNGQVRSPSQPLAQYPGSVARLGNPYLHQV